MRWTVWESKLLLPSQDRMNGLDCLDFNEQALVDEQVKPERLFPLELLVPNAHVFLSLDHVLSKLEFHCQAPLID
jgi:hypothetical protein